VCAGIGAFTKYAGKQALAGVSYRSSLHCDGKEAFVMQWIALVFGSVFVLLSIVAAAQTPAQSKAETGHMVCIAMAKPTHSKTYASPVFKVSGSNESSHRNGLAFRDYLAKKYGYPTAGGDALCTAGSTAAGLEEYKKKRLSNLPNVVQTNWTPGPTK
jgi:hypothetical protein